MEKKEKENPGINIIKKLVVCYRAWNRRGVINHDNQYSTHDGGELEKEEEEEFNNEDKDDESDDMYEEDDDDFELESLSDSN